MGNRDDIERLRLFAQDAVQAVPGLKDIIDRAAAGTISAQQAMEEMAALVARTNSEGVLRRAAQNQLTQVGVQPQKIENRPGLILQTDVGLPKLDPLYEGALIERAQFDGDMPEVRTGPLPAGVRPAVPVATDVRDPVALGVMLQTASDEVGARVEAHETKRLQGIEAITATSTDLTRIREHAELVAQEDQDVALAVWGSAETDHPEYKRGQVPAPVAVQAPTGAALAAFTPEERKEQAFRFLSTTQGRRTALAVLGQDIAGRLRGKGLNIEVGTEQRSPHPGTFSQTNIVAFDRWTFILAGPGATQSSFSFIDTAAAALAAGLLARLDGAEGLDRDWLLRLEVVPVNTVDVRQVGWQARLLAPEGKGVKRQIRGLAHQGLALDDRMHFDREDVQ